MAKLSSSVGKRFALLLCLSALAFAMGVGIVFSQAKPATFRDEATTPISSGVPTDGATNCQPGQGWMWTPGPMQPEIASEVQQRLSALGIEAVVEVRNYGEKDSCGQFRLYAINFEVNVRDRDSADAATRQELADSIYPILSEAARPRVGTVEIVIGGDRVEPTVQAAPVDNPARPPASGPAINRKVYVIVLDPLLSNGQKLSAYRGWHDHAVLTQGTLDFFSQASNGRMNYTVVSTTVVTDGWPVKVDGFRYTEQEYLAVLDGQRPPHQPDTVDYNLIVNTPALDICGKANRGEIDEVWIYNGPYFGFWESTLVGPGAYSYNSPPVPGPTDCNRLVPIMGPSPEVDLPNAIHNFGHRMEATMTKAYGSWQQNRTAHSWERFALVKVLSPNYSYSGCGNTHFPPNGAMDYDYGNPATVLSKLLCSPTVLTLRITQTWVIRRRPHSPSPARRGVAVIGATIPTGSATCRPTPVVARMALRTTGGSILPAQLLLPAHQTLANRAAPLRPQHRRNLQPRL